MKILLILLIVLLLFTLLYIIFKMPNTQRNRISFKESMDLTELPIITFQNNGRKFNFLLDTGSNDSYIDSNILSNLKYTKINGVKNTIIGATGEANSFVVKAVLTYDKNEFEDTFNCFDLSGPFAEIKKHDGVQVHGILGTKFFERYKYILDFDKLALFVK